MISLTGRGTVSAFFGERYARDRSLRASTQYQYERSIRAFGQWLGHDPLLSDLDEDRVNGWLSELEQRVSRKTVRSKRQAICSVWRYAAELSLCEPPRRVRRVRVPSPNPTAWTLDELRRLLEAADKMRGYFPNGVPRRLWFRAIIEAGYQTGLRRTDLFHLDVVADVADDGTIRTLQGKTLDGHISRVEPATLALLRLISDRLKADGDPGWKTPLASPVYVRGIYQWFEELREAAGISGGGCLQKLRRTGATYVEKSQPGAAMRYLGHRTPGLAWTNYIDRSKLDTAVSPPKL